MTCSNNAAYHVSHWLALPTVLVSLVSSAAYPLYQSRHDIGVSAGGGGVVVDKPQGCLSRQINMRRLLMLLTLS